MITKQDLSRLSLLEKEMVEKKQKELSKLLAGAKPHEIIFILKKIVTEIQNTVIFGSQLSPSNNLLNFLEDLYREVYNIFCESYVESKNQAWKLIESYLPRLTELCPTETKDLNELIFDSDSPPSDQAIIDALKLLVTELTKKSYRPPNEEQYLELCKNFLVKMIKVQQATVTKLDASKLTISHPSIVPTETQEKPAHISPMDLIPNEAVVDVLGYMNKYELGRVAQVSRRFSELIKQHGLMSKASFPPLVKLADSKFSKKFEHIVKLRNMLISANSNKLEIVDIRDKKLLKALTAMGQIKSLVLLSDELFVTASQQKDKKDDRISYIQFWNIQLMDCIKTIPVCAGTIDSVVVLPYDQLACAVHDNAVNSIMIFDIKQFEYLKLFTCAYDMWATCLVESIASGCKYLASIPGTDEVVFAIEKRLFVFDVKNNRTKEKYMFPTEISKLVVLTKERFFLETTNGHCLNVKYDSASNKIEVTRNYEEINMATHVLLGNNEIAIGGWEGSIKIWDFSGDPWQLKRTVIEANNLPVLFLSTHTSDELISINRDGISVHTIGEALKNTAEVASDSTVSNNNTPQPK